jgi:hypothetical protein
MYTVDGVYQSAVCFFIPYFVYAGGRTWCVMIRPEALRHFC